MDSKLEDKRFCTEWLQAFPDFNLLLISSWIEFWYVVAVPKYMNYPTISKESLSIMILWLRPAFWGTHGLPVKINRSLNHSTTERVPSKRRSSLSLSLCTQMAHVPSESGQSFHLLFTSHLKVILIPFTWVNRMPRNNWPEMFGSHTRTGVMKANIFNTY